MWITDGTFEGLLTALFDSYAAKRPPDAIEPARNQQSGLFECRTAIRTDTGKSERVWKGLKKHLGPGRRRQIFEAHLSGSPTVETTIYRFVRDTIPAGSSPGADAHLSAHIELEQLARKVRREAHRMKGFVRFQQSGNNRYHAVIAPRYDVLPLVRRHFESRFADQTWIIYDALRSYGICYDRRNTQEFRLAVGEPLPSGNTGGSDDRVSRMLWQRYYAAVNIARRSNPKLHLRQLPRRYWRYLPEKQP